MCNESTPLILGVRTGGAAEQQQELEALNHLERENCESRRRTKELLRWLPDRLDRPLRVEVIIRQLPLRHLNGTARLLGCSPEVLLFDNQLGQVISPLLSALIHLANEAGGQQVDKLLELIKQSNVLPPPPRPEVELLE